MHYGIRLVLAVLAIWRLTHLVAKEDGPWNVFRRLRRMFPGQLLSCFYCLSVWIAVPFIWFTGGSVPEKLVSWWALSGAAVLLEKATSEQVEIKIESDEGDGGHELLRTKRGAAG